MLNRGQRIRITKSSIEGHPGIGDEGYICDVIYFLEANYFLVSAFFFHYPKFSSNDRCEKKFMVLDPLNTLTSARAYDVMYPIVHNKSMIYSPTKLTERRFTKQARRLNLSTRPGDQDAADELAGIKPYTHHMMISPWYGRRNEKSFDKIFLPIVTMEPVNEAEEIKSPGQLRAWINAYGPLIAVSISSTLETLLHTESSKIFNELVLLSDKAINLADSLYLVRKDKVADRLFANKVKLKEVITGIRLLETQMHMRIIRQATQALKLSGSRIEVHSVYCNSGLGHIVLNGYLPSASYEDVFITLYLAVLFSRSKEEMSKLFCTFGHHFFSVIAFYESSIPVQHAVNNLWYRRNNLTYLMSKLHFVLK